MAASQPGCFAAGGWATNGTFKGEDVTVGAGIRMGVGAAAEAVDVEAVAAGEPTRTLPGAISAARAPAPATQARQPAANRLNARLDIPMIVPDPCVARMAFV